MKTIGDLYEMQKKLDKKIIDKKGVADDFLSKQVLALIAEIGEMVNEWRGFKHWSTDQEPRREKMLEEYADCMHFFLSIANFMGIKEKEFVFEEYKLVNTDSYIFVEVIAAVSLILHPMQFNEKILLLTGLNIFIRLGVQRLGFTEEEISAAYIKKNEINHKRQETGY